MPRSFVEQALARCSVDGSRFWFNCNPEYPQHWFYQEWIRKADEKNVLYLHFTMEDNPSLSPEIRERYEKLYFVAVYQKAEKENLTEAERRRVRGLIDELEHILERGWHRGAF